MISIKKEKPILREELIELLESATNPDDGIYYHFGEIDRIDSLAKPVYKDYDPKEEVRNVISVSVDVSYGKLVFDIDKSDLEKLKNFLKKFFEKDVMLQKIVWNYQRNEVPVVYTVTFVFVFPKNVKLFQIEREIVEGFLSSEFLNTLILRVFSSIKPIDGKIDFGMLKKYVTKIKNGE